MHRFTISLNEILYGNPLAAWLLCLSCVSVALVSVARFGPAVARASLVVARRVEEPTKAATETFVFVDALRIPTSWQPLTSPFGFLPALEKQSR